MFVDNCGYRFNALLHTPPHQSWMVEGRSRERDSNTLPASPGSDWEIILSGPSKLVALNKATDLKGTGMLFIFCLFEIVGGGGFILKLPAGARVARSPSIWTGERIRFGRATLRTVTERKGREVSY